MERFLKIDSFLKQMARILKDNPDFTFNLDSVYYQLIQLGIDDNSSDCYDLYKKWVEYFKNIPYADVTVSKENKYFCYFRNRVNNLEDSQNIKVYISLAHQNIYQNVIKIFEFLARNNIAHDSKIAKDSRNDNVVIRLTSRIDVNKLKEFIRQDDSIKQNLLPLNPFSLNADVMSLAFDNLVSYNTAVASYITLYLRDIKYSNQIDKVSIEHFASYMKNLFNRIFVSGSDRKPFMEEFLIDIDSPGSLEKLLDYYQITKLLLLSLDKSKGILDFWTCYREVVDKNAVKETIVHIGQVWGLDVSTFLNLKKREQETDKFALASELVKTMKEKYGLIMTRDNLDAYLKTGEYRCITRTNNLRKRCMNHLNPQQFKQVIIETCGCLDMLKFVSTILNSQLMDKELLVEKACACTYEKYNNVYNRGYEQLTIAINTALNGSYGYFTNTNSARDNLIANVSILQFEDIITEKLMELGFISNIHDPKKAQLYTDFIIEQISNREYVGSKID